MVGITFQNRVNQNDKPIRISFRRNVQLAGEVIWSVFERVSNRTLDLTPEHVGSDRSFGQDACGISQARYQGQG